MNRYVLDASALLALIQNEPGANVVEDVISSGWISTVNLSEVITKLTDDGIAEDDIREVIEGLQVNSVPFSLDQAYVAGLMRADTKMLGLSFGDRACLSLAKQLDTAAVTTDRIWTQLSIGVEIQLIR
ncbi:MAG: type II toxin-antitoxin system VapC family toxin [Chloroflexi bacterium]|nr:type II toxin-antitoxin system VapC family toxin [Chloroflexota bacterium]